MLNASIIEKTWKMDMANSNDGYPILNWQITYKIMGVCNAEQGSVCGSGNYAEGMVVALTATPKDGYAFLGWSDGDKTNPRSVVVGTTDVTYTALLSKYAISLPSIKIVPSTFNKPNTRCNNNLYDISAYWGRYVYGERLL